MGEARQPTRDIEVHDLHGVMVDFYAILDRDPLLGPYFADLDMSEHLPRIVAFWSTLLFKTRQYSENAFLPHEKLTGLTGQHFARWIATLESTLDARFSGSGTESMKATAHRIAYSMQMRLGIVPFASYPS